MNGSLPSCPRLVDTNLKRGLAGQRFNIYGGINQQFIVNDNGVYVGRVKKDGSAALDGRLEDGDKILVINGVLLENRYVAPSCLPVGGKLHVALGKRGKGGLIDPLGLGPLIHTVSQLSRFLSTCGTLRASTQARSRLKNDTSLPSLYNFMNRWETKS
uniref:PDZ domain-containing protein n=1 Tax=Xiphophorus maculatus TaxID=8083 RepID=M3ZLM5_XIPMA